MTLRITACVCECVTCSLLLWLSDVQCRSNTAASLCQDDDRRLCDVQFDDTKRRWFASSDSWMQVGACRVQNYTFCIINTVSHRFWLVVSDSDTSVWHQCVHRLLDEWCRSAFDIGGDVHIPIPSTSLIFLLSFPSLIPYSLATKQLPLPPPLLMTRGPRWTLTLPSGSG